MATTTKKPTTRSKTKTASAKTTAKKTVSKAAPKPVKKSATTNAVRSAAVTLDTLRRVNTMSVVFFIVLAAVAGFFMKSDALQVGIGHLGQNELVTANTTVFSPALQFIFDIQLRWIVVATMLISAILPVLYLSKLQVRYEAYLKNTRMVPFRWIGLGVTSALMIETVALLSGVSDLFTLKLMGGLLLITCLLGLIAERQNNTAAKPVWSAYYVSLFSGALPWVLVAGYAIATVVYGSIRAPWYVYALYVTTLAGFSALALAQRKQYLKVGTAKDYLNVERNYLTVDMLTKLAFGIILIAGLLR